ncbi:MAG: DUF3592 domain-containing protein [Frankiaceae bacterium]|nr:DUF3592 domain-containing protein [Frankiaceae bacterium]MBV9870373.1 DUF3592 domain-containing protein [Frankiaceae bacterium]
MSERLVTAFVWLGIALLAALPPLMIVGSFQLKAQVEPVKNGVTTTGTIVDYSSSHHLHGGTTYDPQISFNDASGGVHFFQGPSTSHRPTLNSTVKVSYDPANPDHASDLSAGKATWKVLLIIGMVTTVGELYVLGRVVARRIRPDRADRDPASSTLYEKYET